MVLSAVQIAKRAFVKILIAIATQYQVSVNVSRDSPDKEILAAYRRVVKKVHPDKGGRKEDQQKLQDAKAEWDTSAKNKSKSGRPAQPHTQNDDDPTECAVEVAEKGTYEVHARGVMLTYHGLRRWGSFVR